MKKNIFIILLLVIFTYSCNNKQNPVIPSDIADIKTFTLPGQIGITWKNIDPINYKYIKVTYYDPLTKKEAVRLSSQYSDTIIIPNTRAKYGDYKLTLQTFSPTQTGGQLHEITAKSGKAPTVVTIIGIKPIALTKDGLFADSQEPTEGPIANLIDGNKSTYFHAAWSVDKGPMPHYIVVKLNKKINGLKFSYVTRNTGSSDVHPKTMNIYVSNSFDGTNYDVSNLKPIAELSNLPNGANNTFASENYILDDEYQYVWFQVKETWGGSNYFALAELSISELQIQIVDPEAPDTTNL